MWRVRITGTPNNFPTTPPNQLSVELWVWITSNLFLKIYLYKSMKALRFIAFFIGIDLKSNFGLEIDLQYFSRGLLALHTNETLWPLSRSNSISCKTLISWPPQPAAASIWSIWSDFKVGTHDKLSKQSFKSNGQSI